MPLLAELSVRGKRRGHATVGDLGFAESSLTPDLYLCSHISRNPPASLTAGAVVVMDRERVGNTSCHSPGYLVMASEWNVIRAFGTCVAVLYLDT
jgi:hypothetical protein